MYQLRVPTCCSKPRDGREPPFISIKRTPRTQPVHRSQVGTRFLMESTSCFFCASVSAPADGLHLPPFAKQTFVDASTSRYGTSRTELFPPTIGTCLDASRSPEASTAWKPGTPFAYSAREVNADRCEDGLRSPLMSYRNGALCCYLKSRKDKAVLLLLNTLSMF
jgi:hypothetical protein